MVTFGEWLRAERLLFGCTRGELALASQVALGTLRDYEQGRREPSLQNAGRIVEALGLTLSSLRDCIETRGVVRMPKGESRYSKLTFGKHRGQRLNEVPADYLQWLSKERPSRLRPVQFLEIDRLLRKHGRQVPGSPQPTPPSGRGTLRRRTSAPMSPDPTSPTPLSPQPAQDVDAAIIARHRREQAERRPTPPDPAYFG